MAQAVILTIASRVLDLGIRNGVHPNVAFSVPA
jgi:hypothetical protein